MMNYRGTWIAVPLLTASLALAACGSSKPAASNTTPGQPTATGAQPTATSAGAQPTTAAPTQPGSAGAANSPVSVSGLVTEIKPASGTSATKCPIAFDVATAGRTAGLTGAVSLADPVAAVTDTSTSGADTLKKVAPAATLLCSYKVGASTVHILLVAVNHAQTAINIALPQIVAWSGGNLTEFTTFLQKVQTTSVGKPVATPDNKAAAVRLQVSTGDALLATAVETSPPLSADQITSLTSSLATQVH